MRVMVIVKASKESEPANASEELLAAMGNFNEQLVKAGVMLAGEDFIRRRAASAFASQATRDRHRWPFSETKELIALLAVAGEVLKRRSSGSSAAESDAQRFGNRIRPVFEAEDFAPSSRRNCVNRKSASAPRSNTAKVPRATTA